MMRTLLISASICTLFLLSFTAEAQSDTTRSKTDFQIFLKQPAKEVKRILYEKNFLPIQGELSEDHKAVIIKNYQQGSKVRVKVVYEDGTEEEFVKSPCFIDPVIL
jgi:hypothetical protein